MLAEPAMTNVEIVHPQPGYQALRDLTRKHGTLLIIDETHTICAGPGGYTRAENLDPDVIVSGKRSVLAFRAQLTVFRKRLRTASSRSRELENCESVESVARSQATRCLSQRCALR